MTIVAAVNELALAVFAVVLAGTLAITLLLIALSPAVWPGSDGEAPRSRSRNPAIISIPAGILYAVRGTLLSGERAAERSYHEPHVRAETGLGAEQRAVVH